MEQKMTFNLLTVQGKVTTNNVDSTRLLHNQTAGNPDGVAAAKSLGDMSHMAFMPLSSDTAFSGELLFLDIWNNIDGLNRFFSDPQVQAGGNMLFSSREATLWNKLHSFLDFHFPSPTGKNTRIVGLIRGNVKSLGEAESIHNTAMEKLVNSSRAAGIISHEFYSRLAAPGSAEALEVLGVDIWMDAESMMKHYMSPEFQSSGLYKMFAAKPASSTWTHPGGEWVEW